MHIYRIFNQVAYLLTLKVNFVLNVTLNTDKNEIICVSSYTFFCVELREITEILRKKMGKAIAFSDAVKGLV